jgi:hypothetical protein
MVCFSFHFSKNWYSKAVFIIDNEYLKKKQKSPNKLGITEEKGATQFIIKIKAQQNKYFKVHYI